MECIELALSVDSTFSPPVPAPRPTRRGLHGRFAAVKVLVVHALRSDSRPTTIAHTLCFARHLDGCEVTYVNVFGRLPTSVQNSRYDLVILCYDVLIQRLMPFWKPLVKRLEPVMASATTRVVMPQDDYSCASYLDNFVTDYEVDFVFSPLTRDLNMLYPRSIAHGVQFHEAFTGYWESETNLPIGLFRRRFKERSIDLGQRVRFLPPQLGPAAQRKGQLTLEFASLAQQAGFRCDVSTKASDVLIGDAWFRFLGDTRFTVGTLGGASVADPKGRLHTRVKQLEMTNPSISHEEIARRLKVDQLPKGDFTAISPRLFECSAMGVCQVLEEAHYVDGFEPWRDYIPLAPDLSNISNVFEAMRDFDRCEEIAASAENVLIRSGRHSYRQFVKRLMGVCTGHNIDVGSRPVVFDLDEALFPDLDPNVVEQVRALARGLVIRDRRTNSNAIGEAAREWRRSFRSDELIIESFVIPWRPAKSLLGTS